MKSKSYAAYLHAAQAKVQNTKQLGIALSFSYFVEPAWNQFGDGT
jgi:hypothetical protein